MQSIALTLENDTRLLIETNSAVASGYTINKQIVRGMSNTLQLPG